MAWSRRRSSSRRTRRSRGIRPEAAVAWPGPLSLAAVTTTSAPRRTIFAPASCADNLRAMASFFIDRFFGFLPVLSFLPKRQRYYSAKRNRTPIAAGLRQHLETLRREGVVIIPNFLDKSTVAAMLERI